MVKPSERVLKRLPARCLQRLNNRQRFVFDGISYSPDTSEDENENENEQQIVEESDEQECEVKRNLDPLKEEDIENYYSDESPIDSYSVPHSLIDAFDPPGMTPVASDEEDEEEKISEPSSNKENVNQSTPESAATEIPNCNEDESREISKDSNNHEMKVDQSLTAETKYDSPIPTSSNAEK
uniref:Uncharacterized protein n=1 Tax=Panagrolaimus sp. PS1159 TaxID=55785 RepID=A0AC35GMW3_9BILA